MVAIFNRIILFHVLFPILKHKSFSVVAPTLGSSFPKSFSVVAPTLGSSFRKSFSVVAPTRGSSFPKSFSVVAPTLGSSFPKSFSVVAPTLGSSFPNNVNSLSIVMVFRSFVLFRDTIISSKWPMRGSPF